MGKRQGRAGSAVTLLDVAQHAGVSPMTASRVINRHPRVGASLRERVEASIKTLGYRPNLAGRSLRTASLARIGVLYSNPSAAYLNQFMLGILEQSSLDGSQVLVEKRDDIGSQRTATERLLDAGVDGVILPPPLCDSRHTIEELDARGIPVVAVSTGTPMHGVSSVRIDDYQAACTITRHLLDLGHRDIGFISGDPQHTPSAPRSRAFFDTMAAAGLPVSAARVAEGLFTYRSGLLAATALLQAAPRPSAILCSNDDMAAAAVAIAYSLRLRVPEDLSIAGFDDTPVATTIWPELTTIHQPVTAMGRAAVTLLLDEIRQRRAGLPSRGIHQVMEYTLVTRGSTAPPAHAQ
ncbi:LacI family DNA-binding transcriptional regulator [Xanthomonas translucens]|uniref:Transcriptional regulator, LacI family n=1 Tax=Xanthomonas translucens pv. translucens DSM 18974 TaxID=1261556 RepID=A0A1C3TKP2_XANCT|nr:LacI family DNA-binding transcriptional regulator [Xanthomonas translucens]KTF39218.1 LacI family transcriptional regulator [Xanthomonas translucens pv. translucens]KWV10536.1 LacI family transcriptional regulator [Xanthomonas translucens]MCC8445321.1 LacI family DNA-binding transcriptional regulator [Xanthomonas translucens pv. translucens]MCS3358890.1 LacI family DNA-binding transcriptional regulator [Xanthomonas translucens pv. translucens]MCS3373059.1 LacI family DNA-binding transcripti